MSTAKRRAQRHGRWAESAAGLLLLAKGYRILERDWRCKAGEIDLIARRRHILAFIEVKHRPSLGTAGDSIGPRQQARIARAAAVYLRQQPALAGLDLRFDAILVVPWRLPAHIRGAWRID